MTDYFYRGVNGRGLEVREGITYGKIKCIAKRVGSLCNTKIDLLLVDVEAKELHVLNGVNWEINDPEMVVTENTEVLSNIDKYMSDKGYKIYTIMGSDTFYIKKDNPRTFTDGS